jgi:hypothetical protein
MEKEKIEFEITKWGKYRDFQYKESSLLPILEIANLTVSLMSDKGIIPAYKGDVDIFENPKEIEYVYEYAHKIKKNSMWQPGEKYLPEITIRERYNSYFAYKLLRKFHPDKLEEVRT